MRYNRTNISTATYHNLNPLFSILDIPQSPFLITFLITSLTYHNQWYCTSINHTQVGLNLTHHSIWHTAYYNSLTRNDISQFFNILQVYTHVHNKSFAPSFDIPQSPFSIPFLITLIYIPQLLLHTIIHNDFFFRYSFVYSC